MRVLLFCLLLSLYAYADYYDDDDDHDEHHRHRRPTKRALKIKVSRNELEFEAIFNNGTYEDKFEFDVDLGKDYKDEIVDMEFLYQSTTGKNRTTMKLDFELDRLVEFNSTDDKPDYRGNRTLEVSSWPSKGKGTVWGPWVNNTYEDGNVTVYSYTATSKDGVLAITVSISATSVNLPGLSVDPNSVKIDLEINNYPYRKTNGTRLALVTQLKSETKSKIRRGRALHDNKVIFNDNPDLPLGAFSWVPTVDITPLNPNANTSSPIISYSPQDDQDHCKEFNIYYTFHTPSDNLHPQNLFWDPRVGLDYEETPPPDPNSEFCIGSLCGGGAVALVAVFVAAIVVVPVAGLLVWNAYKRRGSYQTLS